MLQDTIMATEVLKAGSAIVDTIGPIQQILHGVPPRYLVIVPDTAAHYGPPVQIGLSNGLPG
jgi:hypothetical protein